MNKIMSVALGLAIGYLLIQYFTSNSRGTTHGRLHRSTTDKRICGVCAGIAEYLGVDPTIIRLVWAVLTFGWGSGILLYFICALVLPKE